MDWYPRVLLIGPGGTKGFITLGFLVPLEDNEHLRNVDTYCGVSIGAVISLLMISGYSVREIIGHAITIDLMEELYNFDWRAAWDNKGVISQEPIRKMLNDLLIKKFAKIPTLRELYELTGKSFVTVTFNATDNCCSMLDKNNYGDLSCVEATLFSMNIPFVFYQLIHEGKTYIDGGLGNPYPINFFDNGNTNILGIFMKGNDSQNDGVTLGDYADKIIHSLMEEMRTMILRNSSDKCRHVCLSTNIDDMIGYKITEEDKADMLIQGEVRGKSYLKNYEKVPIPAKIFYQYT